MVRALCAGLERPCGVPWPRAARFRPRRLPPAGSTGFAVRGVCRSDRSPGVLGSTIGQSVPSFEPTDIAPGPALVRLLRSSAEDPYRRAGEALVPLSQADPDRVDLAADAAGGGSCDVLRHGPAILEEYRDPSARLRDDADFLAATAQANAYVGFNRGKLGRLYERMAASGMLLGFALFVPLVGGVFAVLKAGADSGLRLISDLRRAGAVLQAPRKARLLTPVGLAVFLRGAIRRRRLLGSEVKLLVLTAKRDVSSYYHRLALPRPWSRLFALPGIRVRAVRKWAARLPCFGRLGPVDDPASLRRVWAAGEAADRLSMEALPDSAIVYPLPATLPMGLPDSVLIGQEVHEEIVAPSLDYLFREHDQVGRSLGDTEVAGAAIVDDLNAFVICDAGREREGLRALDGAMAKADELCVAAGLPSKASKAEGASRTNRKVAGVEVDGNDLQLEIPDQKLQDFVVVTYAICCDKCACAHRWEDREHVDLVRSA